MTNPIYIVGDIHGYMPKLQTALQRIHADGGQDAQIVFLGDYIDRGPDAPQILDFLIEAQTMARPWTMLKGNHDTFPRRFIETQSSYFLPSRDLSWLNPKAGGAEFLQSYGILTEGRPDADIALDAARLIPQAHLNFLDTLQLTFETDDLFCAHAGIKPGVPLDQQIEQDLIWIRHEFLDDTRDHGKLIVHGHTAVEHPEHAGNRINLDGGAGFGRPLYPAVFEGKEVCLLKETGREPLRALAKVS